MERAGLKFGGADESAEALRLSAVDLTLVHTEESLWLLGDEYAFALWHHDLDVVEYDSSNSCQLVFIFQSFFEEDAISSAIAIILNVALFWILIDAQRDFVVL